MAKKVYTKGVTAIGEAYFANLHKTERFKKPDGSVEDTGKFSVMLKLAPKDAESLTAKLQAEWDKFEDTLDAAKRKQMEIEPNLGIKEYKEEEYFKFGMKHEVKCKDGSTFLKTVAIFDAAKNNIFDSTAGGIGNGSKIRVAYSLNPFFMTKTNYGVSLRLEAVQVLDLKSVGGGDAESFGFDEEEGFVDEQDGAAVFTAEESGTGKVSASTDEDF